MRAHIRLLLVASLLPCCHDPPRAPAAPDLATAARPAAPPTTGASAPAPAPGPAAAHADPPEAEDPYDEDDMLPLARQVKRILREGPATPQRLAALRAAAVNTPRYDDLAADPQKTIGQPFVARGRVRELDQQGGGFTALLALGPGESRPLLVSGGLVPPRGVAVGSAVEAVGYLGGPFPLPGRTSTLVPSLAVWALRRVP